MALADTNLAIGAVTNLLKVNFKEFTSIPDIKVGRPSQAADQDTCLNIFLHEIHFDEFLKNSPLNEGEKPPIWMVLKYMVTVFSGDENSDSVEAHRMLGKAIEAINRNDFLTFANLLPGPDLDEAQKALGPNPSELHATFNEGSSELIAKIMQGPDDKYRLSVCFEVRPVMVAGPEPGQYSLLVGMDYTPTPPVPVTPVPFVTPVGIEVIPSMGARIDRIEPTGFEVGEAVTIFGTDLHLSNLSVVLGPAEFAIKEQKPDQLKFEVAPAVIAASGISAGSHPLTVVQTLPTTGKKRKSNIAIGNLVPTVTGSVVTGLGPDPDDPTRRIATIRLDGLLLGDGADDTILALYKDGVVHKTFDVLTVPPGPPPPLQTKRQRVMVAKDGVKPDVYRAILLVNGQQAPQSPEVKLMP